MSCVMHIEKRLCVLEDLYVSHGPDRDETMWVRLVKTEQEKPQLRRDSLDKNTQITQQYIGLGAFIGGHQWPPSTTLHHPSSR